MGWGGRGARDGRARSSRPQPAGRRHPHRPADACPKAGRGAVARARAGVRACSPPLPSLPPRTGHHARAGHPGLAPQGPGLGAECPFAMTGVEGQHWRDGGRCCDSAGLTDLPLHRLFTLLTFEVRKVKGRKKRKFECLRVGAWVVLGAGVFVFFFACHSVSVLRRRENRCRRLTDASIVIGRRSAGKTLLWRADL